MLDFFSRMAYGLKGDVSSQRRIQHRIIFALVFVAKLWFGGQATIGYDLRNVELLAHVPSSETGGDGEYVWSNDIWGWTDPQTNREYAIVGQGDGTSFVDVSDPRNPMYLGFLPTTTVYSTWRDIKVYRDHAYIVADAAGPHGMQIFDLRRLRGVTAPLTYAPDALYSGVRSAHNLTINEETGFAYVTDGDILDLSDPLNPVQVGTVAPGTHDSQAVVYRGNDIDYFGHEMLFTFNGSNVLIADVTSKSQPTFVASRQVGNYEHQGWLSEDHNYLFVNAELDTTWTYVLDVSDLDNPLLVGSVQNLRNAYDHNLYVKDNHVYAANYMAGLRVFEIVDPATADLQEVAHIKTYHRRERFDYRGAWSVYPFFESGTVIVNDTDNGLFVVRLKFDHGDFDSDSNVNLADLDRLTHAIANNSTDLLFDMNADGTIDFEDVGSWLAVSGANNYGSGVTFLPGDANLDGHVDLVDLQTWLDHRFEVDANWSQGDFNADGSVDLSDFHIWNGQKFRSVAGVVPEPDALALLTVSLLLASLVDSRSSRCGLGGLGTR